MTHFANKRFIIVSCFTLLLTVAWSLGCKKNNAAPSKGSAKITLGNASQGKQLYTTKGCLACHSVDGSKRIGPSFKGLFGKKRTVITAGKTRVVKANVKYLVRSIKSPKADLVKGYEKMLMTVVPVTDKEIGDLVAYIKSLK